MSWVMADMFTGIVEEMVLVGSVEPTEQGRRLRVAAAEVVDSLERLVSGSR